MNKQVGKRGEMKTFYIEKKKGTERGNEIRQNIILGNIGNKHVIKSLY